MGVKLSVAARHIVDEIPTLARLGLPLWLEEYALRAADTGHLVLSCIHSNNAVMAINRIIDIFPPEQQHQIRVQLADNMLLILNQRLLARKDGRGQILAQLVDEGLVGYDMALHYAQDSKYFQVLARAPGRGSAATVS